MSILTRPEKRLPKIRIAPSALPPPGTAPWQTGAAAKVTAHLNKDADSEAAMVFDSDHTVLRPVTWETETKAFVEAETVTGEARLEASLYGLVTDSAKLGALLARLAAVCGHRPEPLLALDTIWLPTLGEVSRSMTVTRDQQLTLRVSSLYQPVAHASLLDSPQPTSRQ